MSWHHGDVRRACGPDRARRREFAATAADALTYSDIRPRREDWLSVSKDALRSNTVTSFLLGGALPQRALLFAAGLLVMAIGVDLSVKANLGVSPISSVPYVYSLRFPLTLGQATVVLNVLLVVLQILLLGRDYPWVQLVQIPVVFLFGWFIDIAMPALSWIEPAHYASRLFFCLISCSVLALGVFIEVKARVTYLPGEGLAMAVCRRFGFQFGPTKIGVDSTLVVIGMLSSVVLLGGVHGIREGTVLAAFLVGYIVRFLDRTIPVPMFLRPLVVPAEQASSAALEPLKEAV